MKSWLIFLRIISESINFAFHALRVNKLRTVLSLTGITIGILTIISVFTVVDSLERQIRMSVSSLGNNVVYVQKMPWGGDYKDYWKFIQRPEPNYRDYQNLKKQLNTSELVSYAYAYSKTIKFDKNSVNNATIFPVTFEYNDLWDFEIQFGRYYSEFEYNSARPVGIIGFDIAEALFGNAELALGKKIKLQGRKIRVIGVFAKQGQTFTGNNPDRAVLIPMSYVRTMMSIDNRNGAFIMVKAKEGIGVEQVKDEVVGVMRKSRKLSPKADDNFAVNEISVINGSLQVFFSALGQIGAVIGGFSILVGGFGIANIMFVSVKERTNQIGIQKSLGAKRYFILMQFLIESITLSLIGGAIGVFLVFILFLIVNSFTSFELMMSLENLAQGIGISVFIGIVSGIIPAYFASKLDPVEAIRSGQ